MVRLAPCEQVQKESRWPLPWTMKDFAPIEPGGADPLAGLDGEFEERAAFLEYEAGLPRAEVERRARAELNL